MLLLGDKPIIEHNIDRLITFGVDTITISVRYLSEQIMNYFGDGTDKGININYIEEDKSPSIIINRIRLNTNHLRSIYNSILPDTNRHRTYKSRIRLNANDLRST